MMIKKYFPQIILITIAILIMAFIIFFYNNKNYNEICEDTSFFFDTQITITLYKNSPEIIDECFKLCNKYEQLWSKNIEGSDVYRINHSAGEKILIDKQTYQIIDMAINYSKLSDGKYDITISKLAELWDYKKEIVPSETSIKEAMLSINYKNIELEKNNDSYYITMKNPNSCIDLGSIAKGFIADVIKKYLLDNNIKNGIINLGGNVLLVGSKDDGSDYKIGIQYPFLQTGISILAVKSNNISIVTSGIYERYFKKDNRLYHHILDPFTGYPCENELYSVTIISEASVDGDALSTTCFLLGIDKAKELIASLDNTEAIFIDNNNNVYITDGLINNNGIVSFK